MTIPYDEILNFILKDITHIIIYMLNRDNTVEYEARIKKKHYIELQNNIKQLLSLLPQIQIQVIEESKLLQNPEYEDLLIRIDASKVNIIMLKTLLKIYQL